MDRSLFRQMPVPRRLAVVSCVITLASALLLGATLESLLTGIGAAAWGAIVLAFSALYAALFFLADAAFRRIQERAERDIQRAAAQHEEARLSGVVECLARSLAKAIEVRDRETPGHTQRVSELTLDLARQMGWSEQELRRTRDGCLLHDIGKLGIPESILLKPAPLSDEERKVMQSHPQVAHDMLKDVPYVSEALDIPYCHHERWDGAGYPRGLQGEVIPLAARLFAVIHVFDALTSERPHRAAWTAQYGLEYIVSKAGRHFDPEVVELFRKALTERIAAR